MASFSTFLINFDPQIPFYKFITPAQEILSRPNFTIIPFLKYNMMLNLLRTNFIEYLFLEKGYGIKIYHIGSIKYFKRRKVGGRNLSLTNL
jgi:hypothetical protein